MKRALICCALMVALIGAVTASGATAPGADDVAQGVDPYTEVVPPGAASGPQLFRSGSAGATPLRGKKGGKGKGKGGKRLVTGFGDPLYVSTDASTRQDAMDKTVDVNGSAVRLYVSWRSVAPASPSPGFDPKDPASDQYDWSRVDGAVQDATNRGLDPILLVNSAPDWAEGSRRPASAPTGTWKPNAGDLGDFARAIATRYSGNFQSLPKVRDYMAWNEPNLPQFLTPQYKGKKFVGGGYYRKMLNAFYGGVHGANKRNRVITGGTAPYGGAKDSFGDRTTRPLIFWRDVLCVKQKGKREKGTKCKSKPKFDVLSHHPIDTSGGPNTSALDPDDVSMPDVHNLVDVLRAAEKAHNVKPGGKHPVWADEFWWESNPPDNYPANPNLATQAKWYQQSLYLLWKQGVSLALFYQVQDEPHYGPPGRFGGSSYETGIYFSNGKAKPSSRAVRFPFVVTRKSKKKALIWGIAPKSGKVVVTQSGKGPKKVTKLKGKAGRIFTKQVKLRGRHKVSAKVGGEKSLKYPLK